MTHQVKFDEEIIKNALTGYKYYLILHVIAIILYTVYLADTVVKYF